MQGFRFHSFRFQVGETKFQVSEFQVSGWGGKVSGFRFQVGGAKFQVSEFQVSCFRVSGFRVSGFRLGGQGFLRIDFQCITTKNPAVRHSHNKAQGLFKRLRTTE